MAKKIISDIFIILSLTTNFMFLYFPNGITIFIALFINLFATIFKLGESKFLATKILATSFVSDLHLVPAIFLFFLGYKDFAIALAIGALVSNIISVLLVIIESVLLLFQE
jgi:hypothetical protein